MARNQSTKSGKKNMVTTHAKRKGTSGETVKPTTTFTSSSASHTEERSTSQAEVEADRPTSKEADSMPVRERLPSQAFGSMSGAMEESHDIRHRRIAERAFLLYLDSKCQHGHDLEHWFKAEREITTHHHESDDTI